MTNKDHIEAIEYRVAKFPPEMREVLEHVIAVLKSHDGQGSEVLLPEATPEVSALQQAEEPSEQSST